MLVFEGEITRALHPELYRVAAPADARPLRPSQLADRIGGQMPDSLHLVSLQLSARSDEPCMAAFRETGRKQLSVDPYTGNVNGWTESPAFFGTVRKLHRWLLDPPPSKGEKSVGKAIVGVSTLALVLILVSGLILWIPPQPQGAAQPAESVVPPTDAAVSGTTAMSRWDSMRPCCCWSWR